MGGWTREVAVLPWSAVEFWWLLAALGVAMLLAAFYFWQARRLSLRIDAARNTAAPGTDALFTVTVENRAPWPQNVHLKLAELPSGWYGALSAPRIRLRGGESARLPLLIKLPVACALGEEGRVQLKSRPNVWSPWLIKRLLPLRVVPILAPAPNRPSPSPSID